MRKVIVLERISIDCVIQGPGGPEEDTSGGFAYGTIPITLNVTESTVTPNGVLVVNYERAGAIPTAKGVA